MNRCFPFLFISCIALNGCTPEPQESDAAAAAIVETPVAAEVAATPAVDPFTMFDTTLPVRDLMNSLINPNALQLWGGVSYVETGQGAVEKIPQTQADWDALRANAIALIEGSNALMLPGRRIAASEDAAATADFQFSPGEIEQLLRDDPDNWIINLQTMQESVLDTLEMIDKKDILGFTERGARINDSCETCHAQYWYRPLPRP